MPPCEQIVLLHRMASLAAFVQPQSGPESRIFFCMSIEGAEAIEDYQTAHRALPDCLVLAWLVTGDPFHAVIVVDEAEDRLFVVTVYRPDSEEWQDDWRSRKR